jgi:hypothetical protein
VSKVGTEPLTDAPRLRHVAVGEGRANPLGKAAREGLAILDVTEDLLLQDEGFVQEDVLIHELVFLRRRLVLGGLCRRGFLRRRWAFPGIAVFAHGLEFESQTDTEIGGKMRFPPLLREPCFLFFIF